VIAQELQPSLMYILLCGGIALGLSLALTPLVIRLARWKGYIAAPKDDRWHKDPTPLIGGVGIFAAFAAALLLTGPASPGTYSVLAGAAGIFALGLIDDIFGLNPQIKLIGQIIISALMVAMGIKIEIIPWPAVSIPLTIFWMVALVNAFNLLDNMDGLAAGLAAITSGVLLIFSLQAGDYTVAALSAALGGAALGFLVFNFNPASVFMGDSGSMVLGFCLACFSILGTWRHATNLVVSLTVPILVLGIPIFDTTFVAVTRKLRGVPIAQGGRDHISHHLVRLGLNERQAVLTLYTASILISALTLAYSTVNPLYMLVVAGLIGIGLFIVGLFLEETKRQRGLLDQPPTAVYDHPRSPLASQVILSRRRITEILIDVMLITLAYFSAYLVRFENQFDQFYFQQFVQTLPWILVIKMVIFSYMGLYQSVWRYVSVRDMLDIVKAVLLSSFVILSFIVLLSRFEGFSRSVFLIDSVFTLILVGGSRGLLRVLREYLENYRREGRRVVIIGAGDAGELMLREIRNNLEMNYRVVGFLDDDPKKRKVRIHGVPVLGSSEELQTVADKNGVEEVLVAIPSATEEQRSLITHRCREAGLPFTILPSLSRLTSNRSTEDSGGG
jgi:UDP-GlcNAc:undecaprenyl-phosphate GlcNAc-1-phosphate transferase